MPIRRVLLTADTVGGVWTYAMELARALAGAGVCIDLATMGAPLREDQRRQVAAVPAIRLHESAFRLEWMRDPWDDVQRAGDWLRGLAARTRPDVVHLNQYAFGALDWDAPVLVAGHSCVLSWWEAVHGVPAPPEWARYQERVAAGLRGADLVVAPSVTMLRALERHYTLPARRRVIYNGRDAARFRPGLKRDVILGFGRVWDEAKNAGALAAAAPHVPWPVRIAGESRAPDGGGRVLPHVTMLGQLREHAMAAELAQAAIVALPARYEPFGLAALEAAHAGCALVLGDIPSQREIWSGAARFAPPDDPGALAAELRHVAADPHLRAGLARAARQRARVLTPERFGRNYLNAYQRLLTAAPPKTPDLETTACAS